MQKTFEEICTFEVLYRAYLDARRGKRKKVSTAQYEANVLILTERLAYILITCLLYTSPSPRDRG